MKSISAADLLAKLPDVEDLLDLSAEIAKKQLAVSMLESEIKVQEANIVAECLTDSRRFSGGKPLSLAAIERLYLHTGFDGSILKLRNALSKAKVEAEELRRKMEVYKEMIELYRTIAANERR